MKNPLFIPIGIALCGLLIVGNIAINNLNTLNEYKIALIKFGHARYVPDEEGRPKFILDTPPEGLTFKSE